MSITHDDIVSRLCDDEFYHKGTDINLDAVAPLILGWIKEAQQEAWAEGATAGWESSGEGWNAEYPGHDYANDIPNPYGETA